MKSDIINIIFLTISLIYNGNKSDVKSRKVYDNSYGLGIIGKWSECFKKKIINHFFYKAVML